MTTRRGSLRKGREGDDRCLPRQGALRKPDRKRLSTALTPSCVIFTIGG